MAKDSAETLLQYIVENMNSSVEALLDFYNHDIEMVAENTHSFSSGEFDDLVVELAVSPNYRRDLIDRLQEEGIDLDRLDEPADVPLSPVDLAKLLLAKVGLHDAMALILKEST